MKIDLFSLIKKDIFICSKNNFHDLQKRHSQFYISHIGYKPLNSRQPCCSFMGKVLLKDIKLYLSGEPKASRHTAHSGRHQMIQITISGRGQFQSSEANIVQSFIVDAEGFVSIFDQLVNRECGVVRFDNSVGDFW